MPERSGYKTDGGWASSSDDVNGNNIPQTLTVNDRDFNTPEEYKASKWIELVEGFESDNVDEFIAYIASGSNTTGGNTGGSGGENNWYRYGFNGKENDDEHKGLGSSIDFGDRIFDPRSGRSLSLDPLQKKYPNSSPYVFAINSPQKLRDVDGRDVEVTIVDNTIIFSSTVFIVGINASELASNANKKFQEFSDAHLSNLTYKDAAGKVYNVQIKIHYISVDPNNPNDPNIATYNKTLNARVGESGNNIIEITKNQKDLLYSDRSNAGQPSGTNYEEGLDVITNSGVMPNGHEWKRIQKVFGVGNKAFMATRDGALTAIHETLHFFGLGDRYIENVTYEIITALDNGTVIHDGERPITSHYEGFQNDIMANFIESANVSDLRFNQAHVDNLASAALKASDGRSNFVMYQKVDNASRRDKDNAAKEFTSGKTKFIKK